MWTVNGFVKFAALCLITLFIMFGLTAFGMGLYFVYLPWGSAERGFYKAIGICLALFGTTFTLASIFGYMAVLNQIKRYGRCTFVFGLHS